MDTNERIPLRQWSKLSYHDPEELLREMRRFELRLPGTGLRRTNALKRHLERRQAALFAYGLGLRLRTRVLLADAPAEALDYDFALVFQIGDERHHWPLQVKELVPEDINPRASLDGLLAKLRKYGDAPRLCVAVYVNRRVRPSPVSISSLKVGSFWLVGGRDRSGHRWTLQGDFRQPDHHVTEFDYPEPRVIVPLFPVLGGRSHSL
jgi:hypothetical protein